MNGHLAKPIEISVLMKTLADVFKDRSTVKSIAIEPKPKEDALHHVKRIYFEMQRSKAVSVLPGGSFNGIVHPDDYERAEKEIWHQIDNGETDLDQVKYRIIKKDGTVSDITDYGRLVRNKEVGDIFYVFVAETLDGNL